VAKIDFQKRGDLSKVSSGRSKGKWKTVKLVDQILSMGIFRAISLKSRTLLDVFHTLI
jgi:hypothetical protein